jgi:uncharacterized Zn-binding protein involved in type VI secretion
MAGKGVGRFGDVSKGHDACFPIPWTIATAFNVFANKRLIAVKGTTALIHGHPPVHPPHPAVITSASSKVFANKRGIARKGDSCPCGDKVNIVSGNVYSS